MIEYTCSKCGQHYNVKQKLAGKLIRCKACGYKGHVEVPVTTGLLRNFDSLFMANDIYYIKALVR